MLAIKNMQMPKKCSECPMCKQSGIDLYCGADYVGIDNAFKKRDNCPLVEIVTCKYCKHREKVHPSYLSNKKDEVYFCTLQSDEYCYEVEDDDFCECGERRE